MSPVTRLPYTCLAVLGLLTLTAFRSHAQTGQALRRWQHLDLKADGVPGISADRAYQELLADRKPTPVLVAVIDSGIDSTHEDLKPILWRKPTEVAGNGLDDDHNGYVDDVRGWSFLGGKDGQNIAVETLEQTRIVAQYQAQFEGKQRRSLSKANQAKFDLALVIAGFSLINFFRDYGYVWAGLVCVPVGLGVIALGWVRFRARRRRIVAALNAAV